MSRVKQLNDQEKTENWGSVRIRPGLQNNIDYIIMHYKEFGVKKWESRSAFVQDAVIEKLARLEKERKKEKEVSA
jgi:metal-responsive CopG/Arc/MetJ family transcriptional regulator